MRSTGDLAQSASKFNFFLTRLIALQRPREGRYVFCCSISRGHAFLEVQCLTDVQRRVERLQKHLHHIGERDSTPSPKRLPISVVKYVSSGFSIRKVRVKHPRKQAVCPYVLPEESLQISQTELYSTPYQSTSSIMLNPIVSSFSAGFPLLAPLLTYYRRDLPSCVPSKRPPSRPASQCSSFCT